MYVIILTIFHKKNIKALTNDNSVVIADSGVSDHYLTNCQMKEHKQVEINKSNWCQIVK